MTARQRLADLQAVAEVLTEREERQAELEAHPAWTEHYRAEGKALEQAARFRGLEDASPGFAQARAGPESRLVSGRPGCRWPGPVGLPSDPGRSSSGAVLGMSSKAPPMAERERKEQTLRMVCPLQRPTRVIYVWSWPEVDEWRHPKPGSRIADQVLALGAVPAEGSTVEVAGKRWQVMNALPRLLPIPPWLAEVVGGRRIGSRGKTARWVEMTTG